ncbi:putative short-chain dehydrogenase [Actinoplanes missouriensis 431]|uniref:Putative short-chain dehydrogenase n=1 Tax=Actinoplanes missouriensis (strain ATCC 14538 / DSM 43046 / CBS 188.64 / JCM 3121 / NBRC 102363 / NCIMB 12654 / NRRL B-3342 / UNCC 431) TaxID=512565 RepID=I0H4L7_ACTM4|nr:SDR family oxidoreductase [Actinoplanes missouriensis]BAL87954.1 putative short-chain dehydrogenase [Actinoplanes missouriensis 431]
MAQRMQGKIALVSGAARGQGASHARLLAAEGAAVLCTDILDDLGQGTVAAIRKDGGVAEFLHLDVRSSADWEAAVGYAEKTWGKLDVLINNAGIVAMAGVADCSDEEWTNTIAVNQTGPFLGTRAAIPAFRRAGGGVIVNTASIQAVRSSWGYAAYQISKAAVISLTKTTAIEYGIENIRANAVCPSAVDTAMLASEMEIFADNPYFDFERDYLSRVPIGNRVAQPEEISTVVLHLASDDSAFTTGLVYQVDGGFGI